MKRINLSKLSKSTQTKIKNELLAAANKEIANTRYTSPEKLLSDVKIGKEHTLALIEGEARAINEAVTTVADILARNEIPLEPTYVLGLAVPNIWEAGSGNISLRVYVNGDDVSEETRKALNTAGFTDSHGEMRKILIW